MNDFKSTVCYIGEVGGKEKITLLSNAIATLVMSQNYMECNGCKWIEPGSQVVSESAISGTPVISTNNGCLSEIASQVGYVIENDVSKLTKFDALRIIKYLPSPKKVHDIAIREWECSKIAKEVMELYLKAIKGDIW